MRDSFRLQFDGLVGGLLCCRGCGPYSIVSHQQKRYRWYSYQQYSIQFFFLPQDMESVNLGTEKRPTWSECRIGSTSRDNFEPEIFFRPKYYQCDSDRAAIYCRLMIISDQLISVNGGLWQLLNGSCDFATQFRFFNVEERQPECELSQRLAWKLWKVPIWNEYYRLAWMITPNPPSTTTTKIKKF